MCVHKTTSKRPVITSLIKQMPGAKPFKGVPSFNVSLCLRLFYSDFPCEGICRLPEN